MSHNAFYILGVSLTALLFSSAAFAAVPCSKEGFDELNRDNANTAYFLDHQAEKACVDKRYSSSGSVKDVYAKDEFEMIAEDGLGVTVLLRSSHDCGDLLQMRKGQRVAVSGTVARTYRTAGKILVKDANCR